MDPRVLQNLRALGADVDRLPEIPCELADYVASLTPEDVERIGADMRERERMGLIPVNPGRAARGIGPRGEEN